MTLAAQSVAAVVLRGRVIVRGQRTRRCTCVGSRVLGLMGRTVPSLRGAHLPVRSNCVSLRHLPLQTDGELKHQQRCNHPVCGSVCVTHAPQRTPVAVIREGAWATTFRDKYHHTIVQRINSVAGPAILEFSGIIGAIIIIYTQ